MTDAEQKAFTQGRAAGLEEAAKRIWIECVAAADDNDLRIYTLLSELRKSILNLSPTPSDAGKALTWRETTTDEWSENGWEYASAGATVVSWSNDGKLYAFDMSAIHPIPSSLEVIGKGEKV